MRRPATKALLLLLLAGAGVGAWAQPLARTRQVTYYNGDQEVVLQAATDEIAVQSGPSGKAKSAVEGALKGAGLTASEVLEDGGGWFRVRFDREHDPGELSAFGALLKSSGLEPSAVLYDESATERTRLLARRSTRQIMLRVDEGSDWKAVAGRHGLAVVEVLDWLPGAVVLEVPEDAGLLGALEVSSRIHETESGVLFSTPVLVSWAEKRRTPNDPLFSQQWHLRNRGQITSSVEGNDVNIEGAWDDASGDGVNIAIVDDGVQVTHPDLAAAARTAIDIDYNGSDTDPSPEADDDHGTACAGVAAARGDNGTLVTGAAYMAGIVGIRLISTGFTDTQVASAFRHRYNDPVAANQIPIYSNSWGPPDNGGLLGGISPTIRAALQDGVTTGRGGRGSIYVFAAGNGRCAGDYSNYDGYANNLYTIAVAATGANGRQAYYSESGSNLLINAPSSFGSCSGQIAGITTTDRTGAVGYSINDTTSAFGGTSSSCPLVAGVVALMLDVNPRLGWRDVQHVLVNTATKNDPNDADWRRNGAGFEFNHKYGFGRVNAAAAVHRAREWSNVPPAARVVASDAPNVTIPDEEKVDRSVRLQAPHDTRIEHIEVMVDLVHQQRGQLRITLTSPSGMVSVLGAPRPNDFGTSLSNWTFKSVAHWGEDPNGEWRLTVEDTSRGGSGTLRSWELRAYVASEPEEPTPSPTPSPSATPTERPTDSPSLTPSASPTASATPSRTPSPSFTPIPSFTPTPTRTRTASPSPTPTFATPTFFPSPTQPQTASPTVTASPTPTPTPSPSPTETPTVTPTTTTPTPRPTDEGGRIVPLLLGQDSRISADSNGDGVRDAGDLRRLIFAP